MRDGVVTRLEIDLDALLDNYRAVIDLVSPAEVVAVVKSEAYGHGAVPIARHLQEFGGCRQFAVATVAEGIQLRRNDIAGEVVVMGGTLPVEYSTMAEYDLTPTHGDCEGIVAWADLARTLGKRLPYNLKVDVGLGRMGLLPDRGEEAARLALSLDDDIDLLGIGSHLSHPAGSEAHNREEFERFQGFCAPFLDAFPSLDRHLAASQAAVRFRDMHLDRVRIGGLLYGLNHIRPAPVCLKPVMEYRSALIQVKTLPAGWWIGYNQQHRVTEPLRIGVIPLGWTDGLSSYHVGSGHLLVDGKPCSILGTCTDFAMLDLSSVPEARAGDEVVLFGCQGDAYLGAIELGRAAGMSTGQLLGKISLRVPRLFYRGGAFVEELSIIGGGA